MKKGTKVLLLLLAAAMAVQPLTGCKSKKTGGDASGRDVIKFFSSSMAGREGNGTDDEKSNERFYEELEKKFNVKIETEIPPAANYTERLQIMLAGGEYPDVVAFPDHTDQSFISAVNGGIVEPVNEYLKNAKNIMAHTAEVSWKALKMKGDDNIYAIPRSSIMRADGYTVRKDWLDKLGLSIPEDNIVTLDQLTEILTAFREKDPDGNGKKDTYGMISFQATDGTFEPPFVWPFGVVGWQEHEGKYAYMDEKYCTEHSNYKDALEYSRMLYKKGLIDPDSLVIKQDAAKDRFNKGSVGIMTNFAGNAQSNNQAIAQHTPDAELTYIVGVKGPKGYVKGNLIGAGYYWCWALMKQSEHKQTVVDILDYVLSDEAWDTVKYGYEGMNYKTENGKRVPILDSAGSKVKMQAGTLLMRRSDDPDLFIGMKMPDGMKPDIELRNDWVNKCIENFTPSLDLGYVPKVASKLVEANKTLSQTISKIIVGELAVSEYDKALADWYKAGGDEYVREMNDYIKKNQ